MKKKILSTLFILLSIHIFTWAGNENNNKKELAFDEKINKAIEPATDFISSIVFYEITINEDISIPFVLIWLIAGAIFFTFYLKFINFRGFRHSLDIVKGKYSSKDDPGEITHFQALSAALSGTVGLGNIAGVAIAISLGGPGATFWMIIAGLFSMTSKFVECTLAVKYRYINPDGTVSGGPMHYLSKGLMNHKWPRLGKFLAIFFCIMCIGGSLGGGNMFQVNQAASQFVEVVGGKDSFLDKNTWIFGFLMAILVGLVIIGGIKSIARVTEKVVPFMTVFYFLSAIFVLVTNYYQIPDAFGAIFEGAFTGKGVSGGLIGVLIQGVRRAAFSNEAGIGSAAIAHSPVKTKKPVTEGFVANLEPFIDTVVVCTITSLVIIISGAYQSVGEGVEGIQLTSQAFSTVIGWFPTMLSVAVILFAFSTMLAWSYYGLQSWEYIFGHTKLMNLTFKIIFCIFIVIGSSIQLGNIVHFSDSMIFAMCFPNILGLYILVPEVRKEMNDFLAFAKQKKKEDEKDQENNENQ